MAVTASRTNGFLFSDLRNYTRFVEAHGDAAAAALLDRYRRLVRREVAEFGGAEIKTEGDSFYVVFDSVSSAVRCGLAITAGARVGADEPIRVGVGIHAGETIEAGTILWAAGVSASPIGKSLGAPLDRAGRVLVQDDLTVPGHPEIAVVGDLAALKGQDGKWLPGVAQVAIQQAEHAARNVRLAIAGKAGRPFAYKNLGNLATIGRHSAVADLPRFHMRGYPAWLFWLFVHIFNLIGFRNRLSVMTQWAFSYVTYQRSVRLITGDQSWHDPA